MVLPTLTIKAILYLTNKIQGDYVQYGAAKQRKSLSYNQ